VETGDTKAKRTVRQLPGLGRACRQGHDQGAIPDHCEEFRRNPEQVTREASNPGYSRTDLGLRGRPANPALSPKIAIFTLRLLLFYIVNNGGKSWTIRAQPPPQQSLSRKKGEPL